MKKLTAKERMRTIEYRLSNRYHKDSFDVRVGSNFYSLGRGTIITVTSIRVRFDEINTSVWITYRVTGGDSAPTSDSEKSMNDFIDILRFQCYTQDPETVQKAI
jgi:hypothetical protein